MGVVVTIPSSNQIRSTIDQPKKNLGGQRRTSMPENTTNTRITGSPSLSISTRGMGVMLRDMEKPGAMPAHPKHAAGVYDAVKKFTGR